MSRVGKRPIPIPQGVRASINEGSIEIEGPKGKLTQRLHPRIKAEVTDSQIMVKRSSDSKRDSSLHGLTRTLIYNMVVGVTEGYTKELEIVGMGYKAQSKEKTLSLNLGFSHTVEFSIPEGIAIETPKPNRIVVKGIDKVKVGEAAAKIRTLFKPEPYKGRGVRYVGEFVRRKVGKAVT